MRDAIVLSSWSWQTFNVPERIALALALRGARVLHCEMPISRFRGRIKPATEIRDGVYLFGSQYLGDKFNSFPFLGIWQWRKVARDILDQAEALKLKDPVFLYSHVRYAGPLCEFIRKAGLPLVHICMDYPERYQDELIGISDKTLVIPRTLLQELRSKYGEKIVWIPQSIHLPETKLENDSALEVAEWPGIPRPCLGYLGPLQRRVDLQLLREVLEVRPNWHFVHFGNEEDLPLHNAHCLPWLAAQKIPSCAAKLDVGVMPYNISDSKNLHCVPLKLFDYFLAGIPVVSTRVLSLAEFEELIYFGDTPADYVRGVEEALSESPECSKREVRRQVAQEHSTEALGRRLEEVLGEIG
jgi:teichuronic acid biosynthesis glycosyltransferase TuaH